MKRPQFSLRTLFIVVTILAAPCWYVGEQWRIVRERKAILMKIREHGGGTAKQDPSNWEPGDPDPSPPNPIRRCFGDEPVYLIVLAKVETTHEIREIEAAFPEAIVWQFETGYVHMASDTVQP